MEWMCRTDRFGSAVEGDTADEAAALFVCAFAAELPAPPIDVVVSPYVGAPPGNSTTVTITEKDVLLIMGEK